MALGNQFKSAELGGTGTSAVYDDARYPLGTTYLEPADEVTAADASLGGDRVWIFVKAGAAIAVNDLCAGAVADRYLASPSAATANLNPHMLVGVASHAIAINKYSWIIAQGEAVVKSAGVSAGNVIVTVATAGTVGPHGVGSTAAGIAHFGRAKTLTATGLSDVYISLL